MRVRQNIFIVGFWGLGFVSVPRIKRTQQYVRVSGDNKDFSVWLCGVMELVLRLF